MTDVCTHNSARSQLAAALWSARSSLPAMSAGRPFHIHNFFQGPAKHLKVVARDGRTIDPVIDGELYYGLVHATVEPGPPVRVVVVKGA